MGSIQDKQPQFPNDPREDRYTSIPIPLYFRIKEYLNDQIKSGSLQPGDQIPTEEQLSESFQVSRMTARRAVNDLAREGRLIRRQGIGTFVAAPLIDRQLARLTTLTEELKQLGYHGLKARILAWHTYRAQRVTAELFGIDVGDPVMRIKRVRYTENIPIAVQTIYIPGKLIGELHPSDLEGKSVYQIVEGKLAQPVEWAKQQIEAVAAAPYYTKWLEVAPGSPLFKVTRQAFLADGQPLDIVKTYYRPDRYSFHVNLYRDRG